MAITEDADKLRLLIGDSDASNELLSDDEVDYFLAANTVDSVANVTQAAADAAWAIAAKFARGFNFSTDGQSFNRSERVAHYLALARQLGGSAGGSAVSVPIKSSIAAATDDALTLGS